MIRKKQTATKQKPKGRGGGPSVQKPWGRIEPGIGDELGGGGCDFSPCLHPGAQTEEGVGAEV